MSDEEAFFKLVTDDNADVGTLMSNVSRAIAGVCREILEDHVFQAEISSYGYDLMIIDGLDFYRCMYLIPHTHSVPYVTLSGQT